MVKLVCIIPSLSIGGMERVMSVLLKSYGFTSSGYLDCPGFWDEQLNWHEGKFRTEDWMIESILKPTKN